MSQRLYLSSLKSQKPIPLCSVRNRLRNLKLIVFLTVSVDRFLRAGVSFGSIREIGEKHYALSPSFAVLADPEVSAAMPKLYVHNSSRSLNIFSAF